MGVGAKPSDTVIRILKRESSLDKSAVPIAEPKAEAAVAVAEPEAAVEEAVVEEAPAAEPEASADDTDKPDAGEAAETAEA